MTLGANQLLNEQSRLNFMVEEPMYDFLKKHLSNDEDYSTSTDDYWKYGSALFEQSQKVSPLQSNGAVTDRIEDNSPEGDFEVNLTPMQIRTFIIEVKRPPTN